jgi:hypothetical protein
MTVAATGIGKWPAPRPHQELCRHCGDPFAARPGDKYCQRDACQAAKVRRERTKQKRR